MKKSRIMLIGIGIVGFFYNLARWIETGTSDEYGFYGNADYVVWTVIFLLISILGILVYLEDKEK